MRTYINFCGKCKTQLRFELEGPISERVKVPCNLCGNDKTEVYEAPASDLPGDERSPEVNFLSSRFKALKFL